MLPAKSTEAGCVWHTDVVNGGFDSPNWCSVFKIKEDGLAFACFSIHKCFLCGGDSAAIFR